MIAGPRPDCNRVSHRRADVSRKRFGVPGAGAVIMLAGQIGGNNLGCIHSGRVRQSVAASQLVQNQPAANY